MAKQTHQVSGAVEPIGPYSVAAEAGGLVFVSGQVAIDPETNAPFGSDVATQTRRVLENIRLALDGVGLTLTDVVKTTVFMVDIADYAEINRIYAEYFATDPPARSAIEVAALPGGYLVEIEAIAAR
jgi:2-iminobutanoate/2-iminopropanoate deaminase